LGFHSSALEVEPQRNDGQPFFNDLTEQSIDLAAMEQQLPLSLRIVVFTIAVTVGRDMRADKEGLAVVEVDVAVLQIHPPLAQRLDLGAGERDSCFELLEDEVVVKRLAIGGDHLLAGIGFGGHGGGRLYCYNPAPDLRGR